jgi:hypothetical protein
MHDIGWKPIFDAEVRADVASSRLSWVKGLRETYNKREEDQEPDVNSAELKSFGHVKSRPWSPDRLHYSVLAMAQPILLNEMLDHARKIS